MTPLLLPGAGPDTHTSLPARAHPHTPTHTRFLAAVSHPARQKGRTAPSSKGKTPSAGDEGPAKVRCPPRTRTRATPPRSLSRSTLTPTLLPPRYRSSHALLPFPPRSLGQHSTRSMCDLPPHPHPYPARIRAHTRTRVPHALSLSHQLLSHTRHYRREGWQMEGPRARLSPLETRALPRYHPPPPSRPARARAPSLLAFSRRRSSLSYIGSG